MEQIVVIYVIILILAITLAVFAVLKQPFSLYGIDYIFALFGILLVWYSSSQIFKPKESFTDSLEGILGLMQKTPTKNENEDIGPFARNMTIYYSAFSRTSYPSNTKKWYNISPYFSSPANVCPDVKIEDTNAYFLEVPSFSTENGFGLGLNKVIGPKSHQLGISANDSFTIFFTISFNEFLSKESNTLEVLKIYANTLNNIGISLVIQNDYKITENNLIATNAELIFGNRTEKLNMPAISIEYVYFFCIIKSGHKITVNLYPNIGDLASTYNKFSNLANFIVDEDVLLSNKELSINNNKNIQAHIFNFGIYNKAISNQTLVALYNNIQSQIQKHSQVLQDLTGVISNLNKQITKIKDCPYPDTICSKCTGITDWTNMTNVILNASPECLAAIHEYCLKNPEKEICSCWNPSNVLSKTEACKNYTSIFNGNKCITPDQLDAQTLEVIKTKYNLCSCSAVAQTSCPKATPIEVKPVIVPSPKIIENRYNMNSSDMDLYNALPLNSFPSNPMRRH